MRLVEGDFRGVGFLQELESNSQLCPQFGICIIARKDSASNTPWQENLVLINLGNYIEDCVPRKAEVKKLRKFGVIKY